MKSKKGIFLLIIALVGLLFLIITYAQQANDKLSKQTVHYAGKLSSNGLTTKKIYEASISASNNEDAASFVKLLIPKARKNTKDQLTKFFKSHDVKNTLQSYKVLKENGKHLLAEAIVKSINKHGNSKDYRNNIATLDVSFIRKNGQWLIELTTTTDTQLLEK